MRRFLWPQPCCDLCLLVCLCIDPVVEQGQQCSRLQANAVAVGDKRARHRAAPAAPRQHHSLVKAVVRHGECGLAGARVAGQAGVTVIACADSRAARAALPRKIAARVVREAAHAGIVGLPSSHRNRLSQTIVRR